MAEINGFVSRYESGRGSWCGVVWWSVMAEYGAGATRTMANVFFFVGTNRDNFEAENNLEDVDA